MLVYVDKKKACRDTKRIETAQDRTRAYFIRQAGLKQSVSSFFGPSCTEERLSEETATKFFRAYGLDPADYISKSPIPEEPVGKVAHREDKLDKIISLLEELVDLWRTEK